MCWSVGGGLGGVAPAALAAARCGQGAGAVSNLCHEPLVAVAVLDAMLAPYMRYRDTIADGVEIAWPRVTGY